VGDRAPVVIKAVRTAVIAGGSSFVEAGIRRQRAPVIDLERARIEVLVVDEVVIIDLHLGDDRILAPAGAGHHPAEGRAKIAR